MVNTIDNIALKKLSEDIRKSKTIYDIVAAACMAFEPYSPQKKRGYIPEKYRVLTDSITNFDHFFETDPEEAFVQLQMEILSWLSKHQGIDYSDLYALIYNIDRNHIYKEKVVSLSNRTSTIKEIFGLNNITCTSYRIFPRLNNTLAKKMDDACKQATGKPFRTQGFGMSYTLNSDMKNYDILDVAQEEFPPVIHRFSKSAADVITQRVKRKGDRLTAGLFPLWGGNRIKTLDPKYTEKTFYIEQMCPYAEKMIRKRVFKALERCKEMGVDIAIFPEMLMTRSILDDVKKYVNDNVINNIVEAQENEFPVLFVMGTIWESVEEMGILDQRNVSVVLSGSGDVIIEQHKQTPFQFKKPNHTYAEDGPFAGHKEELSLTDKTIHIIDIEGIGRVFTHICLDVLNPRLMTLLKILCADLVLVPAFSPSKELKEELESLTKGYWSTVLLCNACSALCDLNDEWISYEIINENIKVKDEKVKDEKENDKDYLEIGFILTPAKYGTGKSLALDSLHFSESCISCQIDGCPGRIIDIYYQNYLKPDKKHNYGRIDVRIDDTGERKK